MSSLPQLHAQEHRRLLEEFLGLFNDKKLHHAWVIQGEDLLSVKQFVSTLSQRLLGIDEGSDSEETPLHPDSFYMDENTSSTASGKISVEDVRRVNAFAMKSPLKAADKVIFIHNANLMTTQAQNALLKTLEAPPQGVYFFLTTSHISGLLPTIQSRCQQKKIPLLSFEEFQETLAQDERYGALSPAEQRGVYDLAQGSLLRGCAVLDNDGYDAYLTFLKQLSPLISEKNYAPILAHLNKVVATRDEGKLALFEEQLVQTLVFLKAAHLGELSSQFDGVFEPLVEKTSLEAVATCYTRVVAGLRDGRFLMLDARQTLTNVLREFETLVV